MSVPQHAVSANKGQEQRVSEARSLPLRSIVKYLCYCRSRRLGPINLHDVDRAPFLAPVPKPMPPMLTPSRNQKKYRYRTPFSLHFHILCERHSGTRASTHSKLPANRAADQLHTQHLKRI